MLCGPWVGAVTGGLTNVVTGIANPVNFAFIPVNVIAGLVTGFLARKQMFSVWWKWLISMFVMAWVSIIVSAPIVVLVYGGVTGGGTSIITAAAMADGANIWAAFFGYRRSIPGIRPYYFIFDLLGSYKSNSTKNTC